MKFTFFFLAVLFLLSSCKGQSDKGDKGNEYNSEYSIGKNPNLNNFFVLNANDNLVDSTMHSYDTYVDSLIKNDQKTKNMGWKKRRDFQKNRSRVLLTENINGKDTLVDKGNFGIDGISSLCECNIKDDTLIIQSALGMHFAPRRIFVKVFKNNFQAFYHKHNDDYFKPFKLSLNSNFTDKVNIESKFQYLQFDKQPNFKLNQQLSGYLTFTSNVFFEKLIHSEKLDRKYVTVKL